jgi:hypothetical protein
LSGLVVGGFGGILRGSTPFLFSLVSGIQWFTLGSTFWGRYFLITHPESALMFSSIKRICYSVLGKGKYVPKR